MSQVFKPLKPFWPVLEYKDAKQTETSTGLYIAWLLILYYWIVLYCKESIHFKLYQVLSLFKLAEKPHHDSSEETHSLSTAGVWRHIPIAHCEEGDGYEPQCCVHVTSHFCGPSAKQERELSVFYHKSYQMYSYTTWSVMKNINEGTLIFECRLGMKITRKSTTNHHIWNQYFSGFKLCWDRT